MREINIEDKIYEAADKTSNYYKGAPKKHEGLLSNNITKDYKKVNDNVVKNFIKKGFYEQKMLSKKVDNN